MDSRYREAFPDIVLLDAYEWLLLDVLEGRCLAVRPQRRHRNRLGPAGPGADRLGAASDALALHTHALKSWGWAAADDLLARAGHVWRLGCGEEVRLI